MRNIIQGFVSDAAGECRIARNRDYVFFATRLIAGYGHAKGRGESGACVPGAVAIVRTFGAKHETVEAAGSADGVELLLAPGQEFVHVRLVAHIEQKLVSRRAE